MKQVLKVIKGITAHPLASKNKLRCILRFFKWQVGQRILPYPIIYTLVEQSKLVVSKGMHGATGNVYVGLLEFNEMGFVLHALRENDLFGDISANIGVYSILASVNCGADSIAVEPVPGTYSNLVRNVKLNSAEEKIKALQLGIGDVETVLKFTNHLDTINGVAKNQDTDENTVSVFVKRLDDIFADRKPVILKIDVEGYEWNVLQGGKTVFQDTTLKAVIIEINGSGKAYGISDDEIHDFLLSHNFLPYTYEPFDRVLTQLDTYGDTNTIYIRDIEWVTGRLRSSKKFDVIGVSI